MPGGASLYELQVGQAGGLSHFLSIADEAPNMTVPDLIPGTEYSLVGRVRRLDEWSNLTEAIVCATSPLLPHQPWVLPPQQPPTTESIFVHLSVPPALVQYRAVGLRAAAWQSAGVVTTSGFEIHSLAASSAYEVRAQSTSNKALFSDTVVHHTASGGTRNLTTFRISELCGKKQNPNISSYSYSYGEEYTRPCEPDYLYNQCVNRI